MLNPSSLANAIISNTTNVSNANEFNLKLGQAIFSYLSSNISVIFTFTPFAPSPPSIVTCNSLIGNITLTPNMKSKASEYNIELGNTLTLSLGGLMVAPTPPLLQPVPLLPKSSIILIPSYATKSNAHWLTVSTAIINSVMTMINPIPAASIAGVSVMTAIV